MLRLICFEHMKRKGSRMTARKRGALSEKEERRLEKKLEACSNPVIAIRIILKLGRFSDTTFPEIILDDLARICDTRKWPQELTPFTIGVALAYALTPYCRGPRAAFKEVCRGFCAGISLKR
jgi:hypothetical protein